MLQFRDSLRRWRTASSRAKGQPERLPLTLHPLGPVVAVLGWVNRQHLGKVGEDLACRELRRRGYAILDRRYRTRAGELDIVARDGATVVFVEVKTRTHDRYGSPFDAITPRKRRKLWAMAEDYLSRKDLWGRPCRFDVVGITLSGDRSPLIQVVANAFEAHARARC